MARRQKQRELTGVRKSERNTPKTSETSENERPERVGDVHFDVSMARAMAYNTPAVPEGDPSDPTE